MKLALATVAVARANFRDDSAIVPTPAPLHPNASLLECNYRQALVPVSRWVPRTSRGELRPASAGEQVRRTCGSSERRLRKARYARITWRLAGAEGIEPSNAGIKIQCLTAWRRPNRGWSYRQRQRDSTQARRTRPERKSAAFPGNPARLRGRSPVAIRAARAGARPSRHGIGE
jgi:hypothetical protein